MRVAHFVQRYPPALGGSEAYFARLGRWLAASGDEVTVFHVQRRGLDGALVAARPSSSGRRDARGRRGGAPLRRMAAARPALAAQAAVAVPAPRLAGADDDLQPHHRRMWRDAGRTSEHFDVVHATAFPYAFPIVCARRLARRLGVPFVLTLSAYWRSG